MTTEAIVNKEDIETIKNYFLQSNRIRDYALFALGINSGINVSKLIALKWSDVYDFQKQDFISFINVKNKSSGKERRTALNENCKGALLQLMKTKEGLPAPENYIFESKNGGPITRSRVFKIIKQAAAKCGIEGNISCQSMKKTLVYYAYKEGAGAEFFTDMCTSTDIKDVQRYSHFAAERKMVCVLPEL